MNCEYCRIEIEDLEPDEPLSDAARMHIDACLPCGAFYRERMSLRELVGSLDPVSAPSDFDFRLRARLAALNGGGNNRYSLRSLIASAPAIGVAAAFALVIGTVVVYKQFKASSVTTQPAATAKAAENPGQQAPIAPVTTASPSPSGVRQGSETVAEGKREESRIAARGNAQRQNVAANSRNGRRLRPSGEASQDIVSRDAAVRPAPQIRPAPGSQFIVASNPLVELPVRPSSQPVRVFVNDQSGGRRRVTLEPVIFGSQDLTGRVEFRPISSQGIW